MNWKVHMKWCLMMTGLKINFDEKQQKMIYWAKTIFNKSWKIIHTGITLSQKWISITVHTGIIPNQKWITLSIKYIQEIFSIKNGFLYTQELFSIRNGFLLQYIQELFPIRNRFLLRHIQELFPIRNGFLFQYVGLRTTDLWKPFIDLTLENRSNPVYSICFFSA